MKLSSPPEQIICFVNATFIPHYSMSELFYVHSRFPFLIFFFWLHWVFVVAQPCSIWDLSSLTRDQTRVPCLGRWILNPWITREVPTLFSQCLSQSSLFEDISCAVKLNM